jgi:hypothetical protein
MWEEGGDSHQNGDSKQASSTEAEERAQEPVEEAEADGVSGAVERFAEQSTEHHHRDNDDEKRNDLGYCWRGDKAFDNCSDVFVVPTGEQDSGDEAAEREELQDETAQEGDDRGIRHHRDKKAVEEVHAVSGISEPGTSGNQSEGFQVFFAGTEDDFIRQCGCRRLFVPADGFEIIADILLVK